MYKKIVVAVLSLLLFFTTSATGFASNDEGVFIEQEVNENEPHVFFDRTYSEFGGSSGGDVGTLAVSGQCDYKMGGYQLHSKLKYNGQVTKVVVASGALIVSTRLPWLSANQKTGVQIANIFNMGLGRTVYYTQDYYRMFAQTGKSPLPVAAERSVTRYYADSSYTKIIDTKTHYKYSNWYCK